MKKAVSFLMAVVMCISLCSCKLIPTPSSSVETVEEYEEIEYYVGKNKDKNKDKNNTSKPKDTSSKKDTDEGAKDSSSSKKDSSSNSSQSNSSSNTQTKEEPKVDENTSNNTNKEEQNNSNIYEVPDEDNKDNVSSFENDEEYIKLKATIEFETRAECQAAADIIGPQYAIQGNLRNTSCKSFAYKGTVIGYRLQIWFTDGTWIYNNS